MKRCFDRALPFLLFIALLLGASIAKSQDALRGKALYANTNGAPISCANVDCHGPDPTRDNNNILKGANNAAAIQSAIASKVPEMRFLSTYVSSQDALDIAAYLGNPNVQPAPRIAVAPSSITFASTNVGSASAVAAVVVSNTGSANLALSSVVISGTYASEFRRETSSTCGASSTLAPGASCRVDLTFRPTSAGAKSASLTIAHNTAGGTSSVPLAGTASLPPMPSITVSPPAITFPATTAGGASAVYTVTASNTGNAALVFSAISKTGANANDFRIEPTSTCSVSSGVAPSSSCRVDLTFRPTLIGSEAASLVFTHNAASGSSSVALSGMGTAAATPTIALSANSLNFGPQELGTQSASQTITVTNVGNGVLSISALTAGGSHVADFPRSGSCRGGMSLAAAGGNCTLVFAFAPAAIGARSSNLTIASNNSGGNVTISVAGTATTNIPVATISPTALTFGSQQIGTSSAPQVVTVRNSGGGSLSVTGVAVSGLHFTTSGNCINASLAASQVCTINVVFAPTASGSLSSTLRITHGATGSPSSVVLAGVGTTLPVPVVQASPPSITFPGVTAVGQPSALQRITVTNGGPGDVTLATIATSSSEFVLAGGSTGSCAPALVVPQGASCTIDTSFSPTAPGSRSGSLSVFSSGTPSPLVVAMTGDASGVAAPGIDADKASLNFGSVTVGVQSPVQPLWLTNTGSTNLDVTAITMAAPFALASGGTCDSTSFTLTPSQSCLLQVQFAPTSSGTQSGTLAIASNAGSLLISLAGEGLAAPPVNQNISAGGAPSNTGGGGLLQPGVLLILVLAMGIMARRRSLDH
jgi:trimeric autotransporter adhesin